MSDETLKKLKDVNNTNSNVHMEAQIIDQLNTNSQSNMTLSAYSVATQGATTVKISSTADLEG
ncbi:hypothetical protein GGQ84_001524 [Desulfitispora alkaliphila]|uniref:hypothetical protein n=1 Tax=Desulfitispora alkaliphila TaxID=622674 RepID=UPI003D22C083